MGERPTLRFTGIFPAVPTPLNDRNEVDLPALRKVVRHLLAGGVHGLWVLGSGGEFATLSQADCESVVSTVVDEAAGMAPVIAGTGAPGTLLACRAARQAEACGADAVFALSPYYYACTESELLAHARAVADASSLPVVLYNNPANTRVHLSVPAVCELAGDPRFVAIKDSSTNWDYFSRLLRSVPRDGTFRVLQGDEMALASSLLMGADGAVLALPVLAPRLCVDLYEAVINGNAGEARELQAAVIDLLHVYEIFGRSKDSGFLSAQKGALELLGLCSRRVSLPCRPVDDGELRSIAAILRRHRILPGTAGKRTA